MSTSYFQYPPLPNAKTLEFITNSGITQTGNLMDDFRAALLAVTGLTSGSTDDLWQYYIQNSVAGDANTESGNPATAGRGKAGFVGLNPGHYYTEANREDSAIPMPSGGGAAGPSGWKNSDEVPEPSGWTLNKTWTDNGANDIGPILDELGIGASSTLYGLSFANNGSNLLVSGQGGSEIVSFSLTTPYDFSTATATASYTGTVEPQQILMLEDPDTGDTHAYANPQISTFRNYQFHWALTTQYQMNNAAADETIGANPMNTTLPFTNGQSYPFHMDPKGGHMWGVQPEANSPFDMFLGCSPLTTPWQVGSGNFGTWDIASAETELGSSTITQFSDMWVSYDGKCVLYFDGDADDTLHKFLLNTAYSPTAGWTHTSSSAPWSGLSPGKMSFAPDMSKMWCWVYNTPDVAVHEFVQS